MPQINRVRVNNVKYNFGTQFYDDFIMRFNCRNMTLPMVVARVFLCCFLCRI